MKIKYFYGFLIGILCIFTGFCSPALPNNTYPELTTSRVIIIDLGGLTLEEIQTYPFTNLHRIIREGSVGLMNTSTAGSRTKENGFISLGSGCISQWGNTSAMIYSTDAIVDGEKSGDIYYRLTAEKPPENGAVILDIAQSYKKVKFSESRHWGRLGDILADNNIPSMIIGNSSYSGLVQNQISLMFMDNKGRVPLVNFDTIQNQHIGFLPFGSNYDEMYKIFKYAASDISVFGIDMGDWTRFQVIHEMASQAQLQETKLSVIQLQDIFIGNLIKESDRNNDLLIFLSAVPTRQQNINRNLMVPVIMWGKGIEPGILMSSSTRREGIITNIDILPTITSSLGLDNNSDMQGRPVISKKINSDSISHLISMNHSMQFIYNTRPILVKGYISLQIIVLALAMIMIFFFPKFLLFLRFPLLFLMSVPFGLLIVGLVSMTSLISYTLSAIVLTLLLLAISLLPNLFLKSSKYIDTLTPFVLIGLITSLALLIDLYFGATLIKKSTLGYDPLAGARYYGIGNEYIGVLIGASIIGITGLLDKFKKNKYVLNGCSIYLILTIFLVGSPIWGSNLGGTIAATVGFSYLLLHLYLEKVSIIQFSLAGATGVAVILAFIVADSMRDLNVQSHFGRTATLFFMEGFEPIFEIISRKIGMNIKLFRYTIWSRVFLLAMAALIIAFFKPINLIKELKNHYPEMFNGLFAIILGSIVALLANDSGIVAAATMLIYAVAPLLYLGGLSYSKEQFVKKS